MPVPSFCWLPKGLKLRLTNVTIFNNVMLLHTHVVRWGCACHAQLCYLGREHLTTTRRSATCLFFVQDGGPQAREAAAQRWYSKRNKAGTSREPTIVGGRKA